MDNIVATYSFRRKTAYVLRLHESVDARLDKYAVRCTYFGTLRDHKTFESREAADEFAKGWILADNVQH